MPKGGMPKILAMPGIPGIPGIPGGAINLIVVCPPG